MKKPIVSVIVPSYNYGHFIAETLASVRGQTLDAWECLVVDDGSTDDTWEVVIPAAQRDARIKYIRQTNGGLASARNTGLRHAVGELVQFLDADDLIAPRKLEVQSRFLASEPDVGLVYGNVRYFDSDTRERRRGFFNDDPWMPEVSGAGAELLRVLIRRNIMVVNSPLVRRTVIDAVGWFDGAPSGLEDWDYWLRCALAGTRFRYLDDEGTMALVRLHRRSMSQDRELMYTHLGTIRRKLPTLGLGHELDDLNRFCRAEELALFGHELVERGEPVRGARYLAKAALTHRRSSATKRAKYLVGKLLPF